MTTLWSSQMFVRKEKGLRAHHKNPLWDRIVTRPAADHLSVVTCSAEGYTSPFVLKACCSVQKN